MAPTCTSWSTWYPAAADASAKSRRPASLDALCSASRSASGGCAALFTIAAGRRYTTWPASLASGHTYETQWRSHSSPKAAAGLSMWQSLPQDPMPCPRKQEVPHGTKGASRFISHTAAPAGPSLSRLEHAAHIL